MTIVGNFHRVDVLCVGDVMLDRYVLGSVNRISPESPVPVLSVRGMQAVPGGAANVARNIASLGGRCTLVGVIGDDAVGRELHALIAAVEGMTSALMSDANRPTTEKIRFTAQGQHLLRTDQEEAAAIPAATEQALLASIARLLEFHQVLVLSDYAKGVLTDGLVRGAIALARARGIPVVVDPKSPVMARYSGATVVTPNAKEVMAATGIDATEIDDNAVEAGRRVLADTTVESVLITRAHRGMTLVSRHESPVHLTASAREVFDVVGAGDTVVATLALSLGAGAPLVAAASLANVAAGIVVAKRGTATLTQSELVREQGLIGAGHLASLREKVLDLPDALERIQAWRRDGLEVGFTNGCFDLLHVGHLSLLSYARDQCDRLIVALNSDRSVRRLKGPTRPLNAEIDRAMVLAALNAVDAVVLFDEETPIDLIRQIAPDVIVKGGDYSTAEVVGADIVRALGGRVLIAELVPGKSTTALLSEFAAGRGVAESQAASPS